MGNFGNFGNVLDRYKGLTDEEIRKRIKKYTLPFAPIMMQIRGDFNFSTLVRNANAFGAEEVFYYGPRKKWDKRGATGTYNFTKVTYLSSIEEIKDLRSKYEHFVAMEIVPDKSQPLSSFSWKEKSLVFFGEEGEGLQDEILDLCDDIVHIPQRGSVRSVNVGTASGIAFHDAMLKLTR